MEATFHHLGVPTTARGENETYIEGGKVYITDPANSPFRLEFLRFEEGSPMPEIICKQSHAAYMVESVDEALEGHEVVCEPFDATDELRVAFMKIGDALIEVMEAR